MKFFFLTILTLTFCLTLCGQTKEIVEKNIYNIKSIPSYFSKGFLYDPEVKRQALIKDSSYFKILKLDTFALQYLINFLSDTTFTEIYSECLHTKFKIADIAF